MNELIRDTITPFFDKVIRKIDTLEDRITNINKKISHLDTVISNISFTSIPTTSILPDTINNSTITNNDHKHS